MRKMHCVVLAGGLGTRISAVTENKVPKALIEVGSIPFLHFKILSLIEMGFTSIDLLVGKHGEQIEKFVQLQSYKNVELRCFSDGKELLGTAGSIGAILEYLPRTFWVTYADSYVVADVRMAEETDYYSGKSIMTVLKNEDRVETSNVSLNENLQFVIQYEKNPTNGKHQWIDYGLLRFDKSSFENFLNSAKADLRLVIENEIMNENMMAISTKELFWDIGTPERLHFTTEEFRRRGWI
jgi:mannose-1-phosphate guanylyltransferase/phosphomannomutase